MLKRLMSLIIFVLAIHMTAYAEDDALDLDFTNAPVERILQTIAMLAGKNLVLNEPVSNNMSLHVSHMNWQQALDLVMRTQHLSLQETGDTWFISNTQSMTNYLKTQNDFNTVLKQNTPLSTDIIQLNYANGQGLIDLISHDKALLSPRGQVAWDQRTNTLIITDTADHLSEMKTIIHSLDIPVTQIRLDARIVVVDKAALQAFGIQLNTEATDAMNMLGAINTASINLGISNPAGTIGFGIGKIAGNELDLQLQALETSGDGKVVSAPELIVSNNQTASIQQGSDVPFQTSTSSGATQIEFIPATLGLKVTPVLTKNGEINLALQVNKNSVSNQVGPSGNMPIINTAEVNTNVLVQSGQTIVLGGIYSETREHTVKQVPVLGGIPGIGWLFKNDQDSDKYTDLLIFVTPSIEKTG